MENDDSNRYLYELEIAATNHNCIIDLRMEIALSLETIVVTPLITLLFQRSKDFKVVHSGLVWACKFKPRLLPQHIFRFGQLLHQARTTSLTTTCTGKTGSLIPYILWRIHGSCT